MFDDYGWSTCPGAKEAVDEFFLDKKEAPVFLDTGQALVYKL
jgi:O-methyltransferase